LQILRHDETGREVSLQRHEIFEILIHRKFLRPSADMAKAVALKTEHKKTLKYNQLCCKVASWRR
jgi:hypothetical protein